MNILLQYLGKVILCSAILYGYYHLFLRNKTFHRYNRFYLLSAILLSITLPLLKISFFLPSREETPVLIYKTLEVIVVSGGEEEQGFWDSMRSSPLFSLPGLIYIAYGLIALMALARFTKALFRIRFISKKYPSEPISDINLYHTSEPGTPFSFFKKIFWNEKFEIDSDKGQQLFRHELFHVREKHSADNVFLEIICSVFWLNPFFHLIKKELHTIHEFLSDQYATSGNNKYDYAEILLQHAIQEKKTQRLVHPFFRSPIKRRIAMILQTSPNSKFSYARRVMALPLAALLFCGVALKAQNAIQEMMPGAESKASSVSEAPASIPSEKTLTVMIDPGHGGQDVGSLSESGIQEKKINLEISKKISALAREYNVNIVLTREDDQYPMLKSRTEMAVKLKPDLFISIHAGAEPILVNGKKVPENERESGFKAMISRRNTEYRKENIMLGSAIMQQLGALYKTDNAMGQREVGIWVLDHAVCPAILLECGYLSNPKDVKFISQEENQEQIARKILAGIAAYANGENEKQMPVSERGKQTTVPSSSTVKKDTVPPNVPFGSFHQYFIRYFNRNVRYPQSAQSKNLEGSVYVKFSMDIDNNISDMEILDESRLPRKDLINKAVVVAYSQSETPVSKEVNPSAMTSEVTRVIKNYHQYKSSLAETRSTYYMEVQFRLENEGFAMEADKVFTKTEKPVSFEGGYMAWAKFLNQNLRYPDKAIDDTIQGTAIIRFIVDTKGNISEPEIMENPGGGLGEEALRVVKLSDAKWMPATQNGIPVKAYKLQPITFRLEPQ